MKVKVDFFYSNVSGYFVKLKNFVSIIIYSFCLTTFFVVLSSKINIKENVFRFATNIIRDESQTSLADNFKKIYPVFNEENYIVEEVNIENINENKEVLEEPAKEYINDFSRVDDIKEIDVKSVFSTNDKLNVSITEGTNQKIDVNGVKILNCSSERNFDFDELNSKVINLTKKTDKILLYNTHTSEAYSNSEEFKFEYDGTYRSRNAKYNMLSVAKLLKSNLTEKGFSVIANTTPHDYGTYTSSYSRSRKTYLSEIENNGSFGMAIDIHRDAYADLTFAPTVDINGTKVAKFMIVLGIGPESKRNPYYKDNLALALKIQMLAESIYPGICRSMLIKDSTYNQDIDKNSILIEIGATGNILEEVYLTTRCLSNIFDLLYVD